MARSSTAHSASRPPLVATCHCGAVRITLTRRPRSMTECNCSICRRYAARWVYCTTATASIQAARHAFLTYTYKTSTFLYHFCRRCGCVTHYGRAGTARDDRIAVNARMLEPDTLAGVKVRRLDVRKKALMRAAEK